MHCHFELEDNQNSVMQYCMLIAKSVPYDVMFSICIDKNTQFSGNNESKILAPTRHIISS